MKILTDANLEQYTDEFYEVEPEDCTSSESCGPEVT